MNVPTNLNHKPIIASNDYDLIDGQYANDSDAMALSVGLPHWANETNDISVKVFRFNRDSQRWSRQSEELPLHRVLDLGILSLSAIMIANNSNSPLTDLNEVVVSQKDISRIQEYYDENRPFLRERILELRRIIDAYLQSEA